MKWRFWSRRVEDGESLTLAGHPQDAAERLPKPLEGRAAQTAKDRYASMEAALKSRATEHPGEDDPRMSLYRQLRVFSHLVYYPAFDAKYPSLEDWEKFASERPKGLNDDDKQKLDRLLNERLSHHKIEGYRRAAHELDIYLKTRPKKA